MSLHRVTTIKDDGVQIDTAVAINDDEGAGNWTTQVERALRHCCGASWEDVPIPISVADIRDIQIMSYNVVEDLQNCEPIIILTMTDQNGSSYMGHSDAVVNGWAIKKVDFHKP